jgi:hypothetical protein
VEDAKAKQAAVRSSIQRDCRLAFTGYIIAENGDACPCPASGGALLDVGTQIRCVLIPQFARGPALMKNVYEVLREKEAQLQKVQVEVEALRVAAPLLGDESEAENEKTGSTRRVAGSSR